MSELEREVTGALSKVIDPETGLSVMRMELIHDLAVNTDGAVSLVFRPSSPICPMAYTLGNAIKKNLEAVPGVTSVAVLVENFREAGRLEELLNEASKGV
jgi:metal-sulfur cluster biosynthetic enzyme